MRMSSGGTAVSATPFEYVRAKSWTETVDLLAAGGEDARPIAGGQSLVPMMTLRLARPTLLVDINEAAEPEILCDGNTLRLSALVRHDRLGSSEVISEFCPLLSEAAQYVGNARVRSRGTIGGSLAHAEATAELVCALLALDARVIILSHRGERMVSVDELIVSHFTTSLIAGEVITAVEIPIIPTRCGYAFVEFRRRHGAFALAEAGVTVELDGNGRTRVVRIAAAGASDRPRDFSYLAEGLGEYMPSDRAIGNVARAVAADAVAASHGAKVDYSRELIGTAVWRAVASGFARAQEGSRG